MSPAVAARPTGAAGRIERRGVIASVTLPGADEATVFRASLADRLPAPGSVTEAMTPRRSMRPAGPTGRGATAGLTGSP